MKNFVEKKLFELSKELFGVNELVAIKDTRTQHREIFNSIHYIPERYMK